MVKRALGVFVVGVALLLSCSYTHSGPRSVVVFTNESSYDAQVYVVRSSGFERIGWKIPPARSMQWNVPAHLINNSSHLAVKFTGGSIKNRGPVVVPVPFDFREGVVLYVQVKSPAPLTMPTHTREFHR